MLEPTFATYDVGDLWGLVKVGNLRFSLLSTWHFHFHFFFFLGKVACGPALVSELGG